MSVLESVLVIIAAVLCIPVGMFCLEVALAVVARRRVELISPAGHPQLAVLIPAHNEQVVIKATLRGLMPTLPDNTRVLVVADNCSDDTAVIARQCGAEVIERQDSERRGKGFALEYGVRQLVPNPPDAVIFLDADCRVGVNAIQLLGAAAVSTQRPIQGLNLCDPDPRGSASQFISGLAFRFKNLVRATGLFRLAGTTHLSGTGMALPWTLVKSIERLEGNVVEDMQLGIDLTLAGRAPLFLPQARVDSPLPQQKSAARTQRTRWEHGQLRTMATQTPRLLWLAITRRRLQLAWLALDLAVPPLSLLCLTLIGAWAVAAGAWIGGGSIVPIAVTSAANVLLACAVLAGWAAYCRQQVPLAALFTAPLYALAKLPIYFMFFVSRQQKWIRTERDAVKT